MTALIRSELRKITSTRLWWGLLLGGVLFTALSAVAFAAFAGTEPGPGQPASPGLDTPEAIRQVYATSVFGGMYIFAMILGIAGMTGEYRYQTITPTFLVTPRRAHVVVAKLVVHLLVGAVFALAGLVAAVVAGATTITIRGEDLGFGAEGLYSSIGLAILAVALWTLLGIGIGTLIRNQVVAIVLAVFLTFLVEPILTFALSAADLDVVTKWLPVTASNAMTSPATTMVDYLDWWAGALVLTGYAAVLAGLGVLLSVRRDVT